MEIDKEDKILEKLTVIGERLAVVETLIKERTDDTKEVHDTLKSHEDRLSELERHKTQVIGAKDIVTWGVMAMIALWGVLKG